MHHDTPQRSHAWITIPVILLLLTSSAHSQNTVPPREITWPDLTVTVDFDDPFEALTQEQLMDLSIYARVTRLKSASPQRVSEAMGQEATDARQKLTTQGVDVDGLLKQREQIKQLRTQRASATNPELDGKQISMPGYALPLEYDGKAVTEFLLVPWVGACIHTPPPPPNQIVHVRLAKGFQVKSRFQPVTVTGQLSNGDSSANLYLVDGSADIKIGYTMQQATAAPYTAKTTTASTPPRRARDRTPYQTPKLTTEQKPEHSKENDDENSNKDDYGSRYSNGHQLQLSRACPAAGNPLQKRQGVGWHERESSGPGRAGG